MKYLSAAAAAAKGILAGQSLNQFDSETTSGAALNRFLEEPSVTKGNIVGPAMLPDLLPLQAQQVNGVIP